MRRPSTILAILTLAALTGCDNGPSLDVTAEPAGVNCATGGFRIETEGQVFYSCNGQATTERIEEGAEGNPCFGPALRLTIPASDGTTRYAYVCESIEIDPQVESILFFMYDSQIAAARIACACTEDPEDQAACESQLTAYEALRRSVEGCAGEVLAAAGPFPADGQATLACAADQADAIRECYAAIDASECSMEVEEAAQACADLPTAGEDCPDQPESVSQWGQRVSILSTLLQCPIIPGGP